MRKIVLSVFIFAILVSAAWANSTEYRDACRQIMYAVNPVDEIGRVNDDRLRALARYSLGIAVEGQVALSENDALQFSFLSRMELQRRALNANQFSLLIKEEREKLQPYLQGSGDVSHYIRMSSFLDFFQLNLITG